VVELAVATPMDSRGAIELIQTGASVAAVVRLSYLNLVRQFPALAAYLAFLAVIKLVFSVLDPVSRFYFWSYFVLEFLKWIFGVFAIRELFALMFNRYPGISTVGRWGMYFGVGLALSISLLVTRLFWSRGPQGRSVYLFYFEVSQRSVVFTLAFVIVTILLVLSRYPLRLSKNALVSAIFFSVLYLSEAAQMLVDSLAPKLYNLYVDWAEAVFVLICLLGWSALLTPETETIPARVAFSTPREDHLLQQLDALNQLMTRSARR
jgi:hypothetical protein